MKLNYRQYSEAGEPVIIMHGLFGSIANWNRIATTLSAQFQVYSIDARNHGKSPHDDAMNYTVMMQDLADFLIAMSLDNVCIIGHSMGGKASMLLALEYPELVKKLVIVDIAPVNYQHEFDTVINALKKIDLNNLASRTEAEKQLAESFSQPLFRQFLLQNLVKKEQQYQWRINIESIEKNIASIVGFPDIKKQNDHPALFIYGTKSDYVTSQHQLTTQNYFPVAEFFPLDGASHWLHIEQPELFLKEVVKFIK